MKNLLAFALVMFSSSPALAGDARPVLRGGEVPIGRLGYPLGAYLTIEGVRVDGIKTGIQSLLVDTVNGKKLDKPVAIWIDNAVLPSNFHCTIKGYETMRMIGRHSQGALEAGIAD